MVEHKGHIAIHAENILPIIKRWLYEEKDIFLRELVSNGADALLKLQKLALVGEVKGDIPDAKITIEIDKARKVLIIKDSGLGMTADEVQKYINQVAFSGVTDFIEKYKDKDAAQQVIGHFGLGFYSAFMVAKEVEIDTLSYRSIDDRSIAAAHWHCDGGTAFTLKTGSRSEVGTTITLHLADDSQDLLEDYRVKELVQRFCQFIRYPISMNGDVINDPRPLWNQSPSELSEKDYLDFFHKLFPMAQDPLFHVHINLDYPLNVKGILYFPRLSRELEVSQGEIKLYCNQVYVADNVKELTPEFLTMLKGVVDCPDLPLNVSRSYLQSDPMVRRIAEHITKKVADKLAGMAKTEREAYERYWDDIHPFVKFGMMRDSKFAERLKEHVLFKSAKGKYYTLEEYQAASSDKLAKDIVVYSSDPKAQAAYVAMLGEHDIEVLLLDTMIDQHFVPFYEMTLGKGQKFKRVDADLHEALVDRAGASSIVVDAHENKTQTEQIEKLFRDHLERTGVKIKVERLRSDKVPAMLVIDEQQRRIKDMAKNPHMAAFAHAAKMDEPTLVVNEASPAVKGLLKLSLGIGRQDEIKMVVNQIADLAFLQMGEMSADFMQQFVARSSAIMSRLGG